MREILEKYLTGKEMEQLLYMEEDRYPGFILSRDGQVFYLQDLYKVNALPGMIDDNSVVVPLKNA